MNLAAKSFIDTLDKVGTKYSVDERENDTVITVGYNMDNTTVRVSTFVDNDNKHVALRCFGFIKVPKEKFANALLACNGFNKDYRWVKFVIDEEMDVTIMDDAVTSADTAGEELLELLHRMVGIADECYPVFMKQIWA